MVQSLAASHLSREGVLAISLDGRVDLSTVPGIRKSLLGSAKRKEIKEIHVDMSNVTLLDTSGVAMLVEIRRWLARRNGELKLTGVSENIRKLIQLAQVDQIFEIEDDPGERI